MLNIKELETRWLKYKIKSALPYIIIFVSMPIIVTVAIVIFNNMVNTKHKNTTKIIHKKKIIEIKKEPTVLKEKPKTLKKANIKTNHKKVIMLKPALDFMKRIENYAQPAYGNDYPHHLNSTVSQQPKIIQSKKVSKIKKVITKKITKIDTKKIQILKQNTENDIKDIIKRFQKNNNPALSLFVAKKQYKLANYNQAYNYALITNKLNNNIEESWIIFAKSLVKLEKRDKAISTLKKYIKYSHSSNAQILLSEILSGKFI